MNIQPERPHAAPFVDLDRERGGTHDNDGFVLSAHPGKSQGQPATTSSSQLISQNGLPDRVSHYGPMSREHKCSPRGRTAVSSPDNGAGYRSKLHRKACEQLGIRHLFTRPYRPRTNGKAERFIRTLLAGWAYKRPYNTSAERRAALAGFLTRYNSTRPHRSLHGQTPFARLAERNKTAAAYI